jgi:xanthine dehydrogenase YagS FAD-binding subunit
MNQFELIHPTTVAGATQALASGGETAHPMGGGQDLLGIMKDYLRPVDVVVDLKRIPGLKSISYDAKNGLAIGALVTITDVAEHPVIRSRFPVLAEAAASVGSPQIRNVGTVGGNLNQRPRCWYFRNELVVCLKKGGDQCYAAPDDAQNQYHAILGGGPCHFVHPSDLAPALIALGASVSVAGPNASPRMIPVADYFTLPSEGSILCETVLRLGEIVTEVHVPNSASAGRSVYLKFRERESFDWSLSSVAMAVDVANGVVRKADIVLGGVATVPWRAKAAEAALIGKPLTEASVAAAGSLATEGAVPLSKNGYKIELCQAIVKRAGRALLAGPRTANKYVDGGEEWTS